MRRASSSSETSERSSTTFTSDDMNVSLTSGSYPDPELAAAAVRSSSATGVVGRHASARRGDGSYLSPGGCTACFATGLILLVSYDR